MRKFAMMEILSSSALASPAMAKDKAWYIGIGGGRVVVEKTRIDIRSVDEADAKGPDDTPRH